MSYIVENITTKTVTTKYGPKPAYSIQANGEWFNYGFKKPTFNIGDTIDFKFTETTYGKEIDHTSLQMISKGDGKVTIVPSPMTTSPTPPARSSYTPPTKPFPIPPLHGDRAIVRQNALTNAREAINSLGSPTAVEDAAYADRIIAMARMFEAYSCGDLDLAEAMKEE
jgi:hypothetical protein